MNPTLVPSKAQHVALAARVSVLEQSGGGTGAGPTQPAQAETFVLALNPAQTDAQVSEIVTALNATGATVVKAYAGGLVSSITATLALARAAHPLAITGLTGGTPGNYVVRVPGTDTVRDAKTTDPEELLGSLYYRHTDGSLYVTGGLVPAALGQAAAGDVVALAPKTSASGRNWITHSPGEVPANLLPTATRHYLQAAVVEKADLQRLYPQPRPQEPSEAQTVASRLGAVGVGGSLAGIYDQKWSASLQTVSVVADGALPGGKALEFANAAGTQPRRALVDTAAGEFDQGRFDAAFQWPAGPAQLRVMLQVSGDAGSESAYIAQIDVAAREFKLYRYLDGAPSGNLAAVTLPFAPAVGSWVGIGIGRSELELLGRAYAYTPGMTLPAYTLSSFAGDLPNPGRAGLTVNQPGTVKVLPLTLLAASGDL